LRSRGRYTTLEINQLCESDRVQPRRVAIGSMPTISEDIFLIWEDEEPSGQQWWLSRAHEAEGEKRELFIAEDGLSGYLLGVVRRPPATRYKVIVAISMVGVAEKSDAVSDVKVAVADWLMSGSRGNVWRWRFTRWSKFTLAHFPITMAGLAIGGVFGLLVAFFGVSSGLVGWPMLAAGLVIGAGAGPALKFLVDRRPKNAVSGPWVRFAIITFAAVSGAVLTAGGVFALFWDI